MDSSALACMGGKAGKSNRHEFAQFKMYSTSQIDSTVSFAFARSSNRMTLEYSGESLTKESARSGRSLFYWHGMPVLNMALAL